LIPSASEACSTQNERPNTKNRTGGLRRRWEPNPHTLDYESGAHPTELDLPLLFVNSSIGSTMMVELITDTFYDDVFNINVKSLFTY
jgi:hypothetical protein